MKKLLFLVVAGVAAGCGSDKALAQPPTRTTPAEIAAYLEGQSLLMEGANIPTHPNGYSEDMNLGSATQCYHSTQIDILSGTWMVTSILGTLDGAPTLYSTGTCDRSTPSGNPALFSSTNVLIENVTGNAECFDITVTYPGFTQEGRGKFNAEGTELTLELFFSGQASGHRCADGAVGAPTVTLNGSAFTGDAQQVYLLSAASVPVLTSAAAIATFLDSKKLVMSGSDIPAYPNGYNEDMNLGAASQCYVSTKIDILGGNWLVTSQLGTLEGAATLYSVGTCNHTAVSGDPAVFTSTNVLIENVTGNGACFDITVTYPGFTQEGRGKFNANATELTLELYFSGQATGHRCADGAVGAATVTLNGSAFTHDAQQVYVITDSSVPSLTTDAEIGTFLDGKRLVMTGANIPANPNGYNEDMNLGAATQCYVSTKIDILGGDWMVTSRLGTLEGAATLYSVGTCNHTAVSGDPAVFTSTSVLIENVTGNGSCFDITVTYPGFTQEGRGKFNANATELTLELFFGGQATGHRCADGAVGAATVTLNGSAFTGNAQQVYVISDASVPSLASSTDIGDFLEGKALVMTGANIPANPNGYDQNMNLGAATQCYNKTTIDIASGVWSVTSILGTLNGAATLYSVGTCDRTTPSGSPATFASTNVLIENVAGNGTCFDITVTYPGFTQEGRGAFNANASKLTLELFFGGQATGHRCADGAVGAATVTLNGSAFTGNAQQVYVIE